MTDETTGTQAPTPGPLSGDDVKLLVKLLDTLKPFAEVAEKLKHCHVVEICEPTPDNPSRNIIPMPREWFERAGDDLEYIAIQLHASGVLSEGQASKITGLDRVSVRREVDRLASTAPVEASGSEREHGPKCWGKTSISDEMMYCYCGSTDARPQPSGETREAVLKGVGKVNGDGWKDTTTEGEIVFVWNAEKPTPYAAGQYPRIGNEGWSASTSQYDFTPATANDVPAILALLSARPLALGGQQGEASVRDMRLSHWAEVEPFPARAEAQDEGAEGEPEQTDCKRCAGNGEIVTDWDRYLGAPEPGDQGDEGTADCPDCDGTGKVDVEAAHPSPTPAAEADRVRIAVEALEFYADGFDWYPGDGEAPDATSPGSAPTFYEASAKPELVEKGGSVAAKALAALKSEGK